MLRIVVLYPDLLGTYGDGGNALTLVARARARGLETHLAEVRLGDAVPPADLYLLGGGEDGPQRLACDLLGEAGFVERVAEGAHVVAVCAGLQILGRSFAVEGDASYPGLGLVDAVTVRGETRSVGEMAANVGGRTLVGFENHGGVTSLGADVAALGEMRVGRGNDGTLDGFVTERMWATYAHGPVLALNPWFADEVLARVSGRELSPWPSVADRLYEERCLTLNTRQADDDRRSRRR